MVLQEIRIFSPWHAGIQAYRHHILSILILAPTIQLNDQRVIQRKKRGKERHLSKIDLGLFGFTFSPLNPGNPNTDIQPDTKTHGQAQDKNNPEMKWVRCSFSLEQTNTTGKKMLYKRGRIRSLPYTHLHKNIVNAHRQS